MAMNLAVPDPSKALPPEGIYEVLVAAAAKYPLYTLGVVALIVLGVWSIVAYTIIMWRRYDALKFPEASRALIEIEKMRMAHEKYVEQQKAKAKAKSKR